MGSEAEVEDRPPCKECERPWMVPRPIVYKLSPYVPKHVPPGTTDAVIAYQSVDQACRPHFPEQVFNTIQFTSSSSSCCGFPSKHRLVKDFRYDSSTGEVFDGSGDDGNRYARLVTLNSWYYRLANTLLYVSLSVVDLQTNFLLVVRTFYDPELQGNDELQRTWPFLISAYGLMLLACVGLSFSEAMRDWAVNSNPKKGDLILGLHWFDTWSTFASMMVFSFFSVEGMVTDIPVWLHPWKAVQPYAAIKLHNARAYSIGYETRPMFAVENKPNVTKSLPMQLVCKTYIFGLKLYVCYLFPSRFDVVIAAVSSVPSLLMGYKKFLALNQDRSKLKRHLKSELKRLNELLLTEGPTKEAELICFEKMLFRFFGEKYDKTSGKTLTQDAKSFWQAGLRVEGRCTTCGRLHDDCGAPTLRREAKEKSHNGSGKWERNADLQVCGHASWIPCATCKCQAVTEAAHLVVAEQEERTQARQSKVSRLSAPPEQQTRPDPDLEATMSMPGACWRTVREAEDQGRTFALFFGQATNQALQRPTQFEMGPKNVLAVAPQDSWPPSAAAVQAFPSGSPSPAAVGRPVDVALSSYRAPAGPAATRPPGLYAVHPPGVSAESVKSDKVTDMSRSLVAAARLVSPQQATSIQDPAAPAESRGGARPTQPCPPLLLQSDDMVHRCLDAGPTSTPEERAADLRVTANIGMSDPRGQPCDGS